MSLNFEQYSLLQTVVEACQKKPACKFTTKSKPGIVDPCPHARKFVEVAYKCRPSCTAPYAVETVMQICHGKRRCHIVANGKTFGSPCKPHLQSYLKVVYACVPLGVLTERYESPVERDEVPNTHVVSSDEGLFDESDTGEKWGETNPVSPIADSGSLPTIQDIKLKVFTSESNNNKGNFEKSAAKYYMNRKKKRNAKNGNMFTTEAPNIFSDTVSDIDNEGSVTHISGTFYDPAHPDMIYGTRNLRPMKPLSTIYPTAGASMYGVDYVPRQTLGFENDPEILSPKSLRGYTNTQFNYG
ncbi:unnamed protein product [Leptidea sinapis]|uniref:SUEL-type lectin domain-containing protein n=1 Tax=Leptidea sinapis TaxID=189913 RepID=A0A5E4R3R9_9NEOP|nr:unnamed protein product [Leptidea sinapis]